MDIQHEQGRHVAQLDKHELTGMPAEWTEPERGRHLRRLLRDRGIDPDRLYLLSYHPRHRCWLFHQRPPQGPAAVGGVGDGLFFTRLGAELRRTARLAWAAQHAGRTEPRAAGLPGKALETTPSDLASLLGGASAGPSVRFDAEGGWRTGPSNH